MKRKPTAHGLFLIAGIFIILGSGISSLVEAKGGILKNTLWPKKQPQYLSVDHQQRSFNERNDMQLVHMRIPVYFVDVNMLTGPTYDLIPPKKIKNARTF